MPLVHMYYDTNVLMNQDEVRLIASSLPDVVARELSCQDGMLTKGEITVVCHPFGACDVHTHSLEVVIEANFYEERLVRLQEACESILKDIEETRGLMWNSNISRFTCFVWIHLHQAAFADYGPK
jgi:hypothetical protein